MQEGAVAMTNAVDWPVIGDHVTSPCLSKGIHARGEPLHVGMTHVCPNQEPDHVMWLLGISRSCIGAYFSTVPVEAGVHAQKAK